MPYKDPAKLREYQRRYQSEWHRRRKRRFFQDKECAVCGATENLVLGSNSSQPLRDIAGINPWSMSEARFNRLVEEHGVVLCRSCFNRQVSSYRKDASSARSFTYRVKTGKRNMERRNG